MEIFNKKHLASIIADKRTVYPNSTSAQKAEGLQMVLNEAFGQGSVAVEVVRALAADYEETDLPNAREVATQKSVYFQEQLGAGTVTAGADTVFRIKKDGKWVNLSKLERLGRELTQQETMAQYESLFNVLCNPENGVGEMMWDVSLAITNGGTDTFNERIYIQYEPIDKELFEGFFWEAVDSGMIYKSNSRMAMVEMLAVSGAVKNMAFLGKGGELKRMSREPNKELLQLAITDVVTTMPTAYLNGLTMDNRVF
ncbi:MAG: hypothetical protein OEX81_00690 [Candidatus Pacebacteria bacterium]|nr:hypothetical protein [Candidatus Paceibacterota bacterium]